MNTGGVWGEYDVGGWVGGTGWRGVGRGKECERLGRDIRQAIRRLIPEWGGDLFYIVPVNVYPVYTNASLMQKRQVDEDRMNLHSHTRCVGYMEEEGGGKEGHCARHA